MINNLKEQIRKLIDLQQIDKEIYDLSQKKDFIFPEELKKINEEFEQKKSTLKESEEALKKFQLKRKDKELELQQKEENIRKAQAQLYQLKTNKEYHAKLSEIEALKADTSVFEEEIIKILEEIEKQQKIFAEKKQSIAEEEKKHQEKKKEIEDNIKIAEDKIKTLTNKRNIIAKEVDSSILPIYERLLKNKGGVALSCVSGNMCSACHMRVTEQTINEIKMYDKLVFCGSCARILYIKEDFS